MKKSLFIIAIAFIAVSLSTISCEKNNTEKPGPEVPGGDTTEVEEPVEIESISVEPTSAEMLIGDNLTLMVTVLPENAEVENISYTSDDTSIATVDENGTVTATGSGRTSIFVESANVKDTCVVQVYGGNKFPSQATVGDFYLSDGSLLDVSTDAATVASHDVIGIVYSTDTTRMGAAEKQALIDKGIEPHGSVMATKHVGDITYSNMWFYDAATQGWDRDEREIGIPYAYVVDDYYASYELSDADIEGYLYTKLIREKRADDFENGMYPIFRDAVAFNETVPAPGTSTGWYLPATGQWFDILRNLAGATLNTTSSFFDGETGNFFWLGKGDVPELMNANFEKVADDDKTMFDPVTNQLWTSSQASSNQARVIIFDNASFIHSFWYYKYYYFGARCVLGF
ncbi:MAG: Ig-like domain-containing protein [Bacteroidetes bacterium]|uniref:Ig-like domain-containing protein n=1 Tax=Candidatus Merdivivens pullistercoris TaxID=2840873 RepID=A0A9D9N8P1_9BACT|nr:Ig-like domain-containing protein [Candidatus Merdivivens pullistercoris]